MAVGRDRGGGAEGGGALSPAWASEPRATGRFAETAPRAWLQVDLNKPETSSSQPRVPAVLGARSTLLFVSEAALLLVLGNRIFVGLGPRELGS
jgi:hypothetical protein